MSNTTQLQLILTLNASEDAPPAVAGATFLIDGKPIDFSAATVIESSQLGGVLAFRAGTAGSTPRTETALHQLTTALLEERIVAQVTQALRTDAKEEQEKSIT